MKIIAFSFDAAIVSTLFLWCDECRRPRRGAPAADWRVKNTLLPAVPRRGPEAGVLRIKDDFHGSGVIRIDSTLFLIVKRYGGKRFFPSTLGYVPTNPSQQWGRFSRGLPPGIAFIQALRVKPGKK